MKSAAEKLLAIFTGEGIQLPDDAAPGQMFNPLDEAEQAAVQSAVRTKMSFSVKDGFLERVVTYCDTQKQLEAVLEIVKPTLMLKGGQFVEKVSKDRQNTVLIEFASELLSEKLGVKEE
jgi:hypothetical protein